MEQYKNQPCTTHTTNQVPFIVVKNNILDIQLAEQGSLADIAPTILKELNIEKPKIMSGNSLIL